jgi:hypothetical protein
MVTNPLMKLSRLMLSSMVPARFNSEVLLTIHSRAIKEMAKKISGELCARGLGIRSTALSCRALGTYLPCTRSSTRGHKCLHPGKYYKVATKFGGRIFSKKPLSPPLIKNKKKFAKSTTDPKHL